MLEPSAASDKRARSAAVLKHQRGPGDGDVPKSVVHGRMLLLTPANMVPTPLACSRVRGPMRAGGILIPAPAAAHTPACQAAHTTPTGSARKCTLWTTAQAPAIRDCVRSALRRPAAHRRVRSPGTNQVASQPSNRPGAGHHAHAHPGASTCVPCVPRATGIAPHPLRPPRFARFNATTRQQGAPAPCAAADACARGERRTPHTCYLDVRHSAVDRVRCG
jgi:hypothetical protein